MYDNVLFYDNLLLMITIPFLIGVGESHSTSTTDVPGHVTDPVDHVISNVTNLRYLKSHLELIFTTGFN